VLGDVYMRGDPKQGGQADPSKAVVMYMGAMAKGDAAAATQLGY
jgi:hypothetical protein